MTPDWIVVPTRNREKLALRCVSALARGCLRSPKPSGIIVSDDSESGAVAKLRSELSAISRRTGVAIHHVARDGKVTLGRRLSRKSGVPHKVVSFALFGSDGAAAFGANQNTGHLLTKGATIVSVDDDIVATTARCFRHMAHDEHANEVFYAPASHQGELEELTRASRANVIEDIGAALARARAIAPGVPHICVPGLYGDSGAESSIHVLLSAHRAARGLFSDMTGPDLAGRLRARLAISHSPRPGTGPMRGFMSAIYGMSNFGPSAPFFPMFRGTDSLFGRSLHALSSGSQLSTLPYAMRHDPPEARESRGAVVLWRVCELLTMLLARFDNAHTPLFSAERSIARLGSFLISHGEADERAFTALLHHCFHVHTTQFAAQLLQICEQDTTPDAIRTQCHAALLDLEGRLADPLGWIPSDLDRRLTPERATALLRSLVLQWGELCACWHDLERAAQAGLELEEWKL